MKNAKVKIALGIAVVGGLYFSFRKTEIEPEDLEVTRIEKQTYETLSAKDVKSEIELLTYALDHAYSGKIPYPEKYQTMIEDLAKISESVEGSISNDEFYKKVDGILSQFPDGHLDVVSPRKREEFRRKIACDNSLEIQTDKEAQSFEKTIGTTKAFIVELPTFEIPDRKSREKLTDAIYDHLNAGAMVIDLRGNTGGRLNVPLQIGSMLWGESYRLRADIQYYPMPVKTVGSVSSPAVRALWKNVEVIFQSDRGRDIASEAAKGFFEKILTYNEYAYGSTRKKWYVREYDIPENVEREENTLTYEDSHFKERGFKKPIFLIVDNQCASACERLLEALEAHPNVHVLGQRTMGAAQFGNIGALVLPKSHLQITIATSYAEYKDSRQVERTGYQPQVLLAEDEDPYARIAKMLK